REPEVQKLLSTPGSMLYEHRILPYGVSMEMSSLFIWEHVNPFIKQLTGGRAYVSRVESREHQRNSAFIEVDEACASSQARRYRSLNVSALPLRKVWDFRKPERVLLDINGR